MISLNLISMYECFFTQTNNLTCKTHHMICFSQLRRIRKDCIETLKKCLYLQNMLQLRLTKHFFVAQR